MNAPETRTANDNDGSFGVGTIYESPTWRIQRYRTSIHVWPLANAGKRGKVVTRRSIASDRTDAPFESFALELTMWADRGATEERMDKALDEMASACATTVFRYDLKGVRVEPFGKLAVCVEGANFEASFEVTDFEIRRKDDPNDTTSIARGKVGCDRLYRAVKADIARIEAMTYDEVREFARGFAAVHEYSACD